MKTFNMLVTAIAVSMAQVAVVDTANAGSPGVISGLVVGVMNGDTIDVLDSGNHKHQFFSLKGNSER